MPPKRQRAKSFSHERLTHERQSTSPFDGNYSAQGVNQNPPIKTVRFCLEAVQNGLFHFLDMNITEY